MADNFGTLNPTTDSNADDQYLLRQGGIDYRQSRETLAAGVSNSRWIATSNYDTGSEVLGSNNLPYKAVNSSGPSNGGSVNPVTDFTEGHWRLNSPDALPLNGNWNGFFDPEHQEHLLSPAGYPATSAAGGTSYSDGDEWSVGNFASGGTISSDSDGVIFSVGIYKTFNFTAKQVGLLDVTEIPVQIVSEDGNSYFVDSSTAGVNISKPLSTEIKVELTSEIFTTLGITKVWAFFTTNSIGKVPMLGTRALLEKFIGKRGDPRKWEDVSSARAAGTTYTNTTDFPIKVVITVADGVNGGASLSVDGVRLASHDSLDVDRNTMTVEVSSGSTYILSFTGSQVLIDWVEFRV